MSDNNGVHYFLKKEERKSLQPKKPRKRMTSFLIILGDILFILLVYTLVFKPAMEKFDKQQEKELKQFTINNVLFSYSVFERKNDILIDVLAKNKSKNIFEINKDQFYIEIVSTENPFIVKPLFDKFTLNPDDNKHIPFFIDKTKLEKQFYFKVIYKSKIIKESETIIIKKY